ncbi:hypothetical protein BDZ94DRAFT_1338123 [Collybia nuda]|uniref:Uncharacterized protein n=1 Tax=Collybia nuda TaxID=64659 RepID=A0A9P5XVT4_9AGAR|nr:hypothetical protein BDZ94DRAFT_1338123 [Collybia nuda]
MSLLSHIGYVPSYKPKNPRPVPKLLEDEEAWETLLNDVDEYISSSKAKKGGKGTVKPFSIAIVDTSGPDPKETRKKVSKNKAAEPEIIMPPGELSDHELLRKLEKRHHCANCDKPCIVLQTGDHYTLTHADTATWVTLLIRSLNFYKWHQATIDHPPDNLKLDITRQHSAKKAIQATAVKNESATPPWMEQMMMIMGASAIHTSQALCLVTGGSAEVPITPGPPHHVASAPPTPCTPSPALPKRSADSDLSVEIDDSPELSTWLLELDTDPVRGKLNVNYQQYADALQCAGLLELADLADLAVDKLQELGGMPFGTAKRVLKFAAMDLLKLTSSKRPHFN